MSLEVAVDPSSLASPLAKPQDPISSTMSTGNNMMASTSHDDKDAISHVEAADDDDVQKPANGEKVDEFGASAKTDSKEIALVKKLDWHMMVGALFRPG